MTDTNPRAVIGGNNPPPDSTLDTWTLHVNELFELAEGFGAIENDANAEAVAKLKADATAAERDIKKAVTDERKPHMDAAKAVSDAYKPTLARASLVKDMAAKLLKPWLEKQEAAKREAERKAREEAAAAEEDARKAAQEAQADDIASQEAARAAEEAAKRAKTNAKRAASDTARAATDGRAVSLRTVGYDVTITDRKALLYYVAQQDADALVSWLMEWAEKRARATKGGDIPGCVVEPRKVAA